MISAEDGPEDRAKWRTRRGLCPIVCCMMLTNLCDSLEYYYYIIKHTNKCMFLNYAYCDTLFSFFFTGESVPVSKTSLLRIDKSFDLKEHSSSVLFCGTKVIQTRYYNNEPVK